jgi:hypothetical protein
MGKMLFPLYAAMMIARTCTVSTGDGGDNGSSGDTGNAATNVPWVQQQNDEYCGPASILMWALHDDITNLTQTIIGDKIGTSLATGSSPAQILYGVNYFTATGRDAGLDYGGGTADEIGYYYSSEVTSLINSVPFAVLINGSLHAGVASGGSWYVDPDSGYYVWSSVVFQDPELGPNIPYIPAAWAEEDITHIVSASASEGATDNYNKYGGRVRMVGAGGTIKPLPDLGGAQ